ncbi:MAG TPA: T9SS type A sorting domain-containing protein, partial [Candidatus Marinimicrobia bacterium]|nr:T9SS type A sorting domain-containing protein [Candidatus Neomarinimicrobiota bacterium]
PNPFNPTTTIGYQLPISGYLTLKVYNLLGQEVATIFEGVQSAGNYSVTFDANGLTGGIYFYQLKAGNFVENKKFILLK